MIDGQLSSNLASVVVTLLSIVGSLSTLVVANSAVLVFFFPLGSVYLDRMRQFRPVSLSLKRLEGRTRAPGE